MLVSLMLFPNRTRLYSSRRVWVGWVWLSHCCCRYPLTTRVSKICLLCRFVDTVATPRSSDLGLYTCSCSRTGLVCTPRDGFGRAGYCRHHSATQEIGRMYEIYILA